MSQYLGCSTPELILSTETAAESLYLDGKTDAAFGAFPTSNHSDYLAGYSAGIRELPVDADGRIIRPSPAQHFAFGFADEF